MLDKDMKVWNDLQEALMSETKLTPPFCLAVPSSSSAPVGEVTLGMRDGAAQVLRCLKVCFSAGSRPFCLAIQLMDRFLTCLKARPRHLSCIALACFSLALKAMPSSSSEFDDEGEEDDDGEEFVQPDPGDLVRMSQGRCTAGDVQRMARLVSAKLGFVPTDSANNTVATPFTMLVLLHRAHTIIAQALGVPESVWRLDVKKLSLEMELLCCDGRLSSSRPSVLALALLRCTVEESLRKGSGPSQGILALSPLLQLQEFCKASKEELLEVYGKVREVVESYESDGPSQSRLRQRLVWRLSPRTLKLLRPTQQLLPQRLLPPIQESPSQHDE